MQRSNAKEIHCNKLPTKISRTESERAPYARQTVDRNIRGK